MREVLKAVAYIAVILTALLLILSSEGCAPARREIVLSGPVDVAIVEQGGHLWLIGESDTLIKIARSEDGLTSVTVQDRRTKTTLRDLGAGLIGAMAGWLAKP